MAKQLTVSTSNNMYKSSARDQMMAIIFVLGLSIISCKSVVNNSANIKKYDSLASEMSIIEDEARGGNITSTVFYNLRCEMETGLRQQAKLCRDSFSHNDKRFIYWDSTYKSFEISIIKLLPEGDTVPKKYWPILFGRDTMGNKIKQ